MRKVVCHSGECGTAYRYRHLTITLRYDSMDGRSMALMVDDN
jgi:hypothetical protein